MHGCGVWWQSGQVSRVSWCNSPFLLLMVIFFFLHPGYKHCSWSGHRRCRGNGGADRDRQNPRRDGLHGSWKDPAAAEIRSVWGTVVKGKKKKKSSALIGLLLVLVYEICIIKIRPPFLCRSSALFAWPCGLLTLDTLMTQFTEAAGWEEPFTISRSLSLWLLLPFQKVKPQRTHNHRFTPKPYILYVVPLLLALFSRFCMSTVQAWAERKKKKCAGTQWPRMTHKTAPLISELQTGYKMGHLVWFPFYICRPSCCHHYLPGTGYSKDGQEERDCPQPAISGDPGMHLRHMLWQNGNPDHKPDVGVPSKIWEEGVIHLKFYLLYWPKHILLLLAI